MRCPISTRLPLLVVLCASILGSAPLASAQSSSGSASGPGSFAIIAGQVAALFPVVEAEVIDVTDGRVTVSAGGRQGVPRGLELVAFREGRELYHPTTKQLLGRTEETLGRLVVADVFDNHAVALAIGDAPRRPLRPGDKVRVPVGKVRLTVVPLVSGPRSRLVDAAIDEVVKELERTARIQVVFGEQINVWLTQEGVSAGAFMRGTGVKAASQRFGLSHLLAVHVTSPQGKPFVEVRLFSGALDATVLQHAFSVPASLKPPPARQFSEGPGGGDAKLERRSMLARLLSGDFEPNTYSAGAQAIPLRSLATFPFIVTSMDVAVAAGDKLPRLVLTDGQRVFLYRLSGDRLEPEWTYDRRMLGQILTVQFADLDSDGVLDVVVNRQDVRTGMLSYILTTRAGRPHILLEHVPLILLAVDEAGDGIPREVWGQPQNGETFFTPGAITRYRFKDQDLVAAGHVKAHDTFRPTGSRFAQVGGQDGRVLAFVDEQNRLKITSSGQETWRSLTAVGGGLARAHLQTQVSLTMVDKFVNVEPNPLAVDLDGDGVQEIVVPVNQDESGRIAVVFRGPVGFRLQLVSSGFEGLITGLGAVPGEAAPSLIAAVVKRSGLFRTSGQTQIIMTVTE